MMGTRITGFGHHAPARRVENAELEARLGLAPGWIEQRVGIAARHYAAPDEALTDIARPAAQRALAAAARDDIGFLILATSTPDHLLPPSAPLLAHQLGLTCGAADLAGACAGFIDGLALADGMARSTRRSVLVVAANILSRRVDPADAATAALFADAAGAVVVSPDARAESGVLAADLVSDGAGYDLIHIPAGGSRRPFQADTPAADLMMKMPNGGNLFSRAVDTMAGASARALASAGLRVSDVDHFIPHQANLRITAAVERRLGMDPARTLSSLREYGNSSAATIPLTLSLRAAERGVSSGDIVLFSAVGAGLSGGAVVFRW